MITKSFGYGKGLRTNKPQNDKIMTPLVIAKQIIDLFNIKGKVLDPFLGDGAFYNQYPQNIEKYWCEIDKGKDFFDFKEKVE